MKLNTGLALDAPRRRDLRDVSFQRGADGNHDSFPQPDILNYAAGKGVAGAVAGCIDRRLQLHADGCADRQSQLFSANLGSGVNPERFLPLCTGFHLSVLAFEGGDSRGSR